MSTDPLTANRLNWAMLGLNARAADELYWLGVRLALFPPAREVRS